MLKCPNHELSRDIIVQNFYARLSLRDKEMLDSSSAGSFSSRQIEFKWDLIEIIKCNTEDWEVDKGKELGINLEYDCVKSFVETDIFQELSAKYGLDSDIVVNFCKLLLHMLISLRRNGLNIRNLLRILAKNLLLILLK